MKSRILVAVFLVLCLRGSVAGAQPVVTITQPMAGTEVLGYADIAGSFSSTYAVTGVQAAVNTVTQSLSFTSTSFNGQMSLSTVPAGPITLVLTATDSIGQTGSASVPLTLIHNNPPSLDVVTPNGFGATVRLQATCIDTDMHGCASISVAGITVNAASIDQTVTLTGSGPVRLTFTATDTRGLTTSVSRMGYIPAPPGPNEVGHGDGPILDFDATRILYTTDYSLVIRPRGGGSDVVIGPGNINTAQLTSRGAIWPGGEWRDGTLLSNTVTSSVVAQGDSAGWLDMDRLDVYYRNVASDFTQMIAKGQTAGAASDLDLAANGDAVFIQNLEGTGISIFVYRYRAGSLQAISGGACIRRCLGPVKTDGINVVFTAHDSLQSTEGYRLATYLTLPDGNVLTLEPRQAFGGEPYHPPWPSYAVAGGWTAFTKLVGRLALPFTRSPCGGIAMLGGFNVDHTIEAVSDDGEVVFAANGTRYLGRAGQIPAPFPLSGRAVYQNGWYTVDDYILNYLGPPANDGGSTGGCVDGGSGDAGSDASIDGGSVSDASSDVSSGDGASNDATVDAFSTEVSVDGSPDHAVPSDGSLDAPEDNGRVNDASSVDAGSSDASLDLIFRDGDSTADASLDSPFQDIGSKDGTARDGISSDAGQDPRLADSSTDRGLGADGNVEEQGSGENGCGGCSTSPREGDGMRSILMLMMAAGLFVNRRLHT
jgi:hypothetical protein